MSLHHRDLDHILERTADLWKELRGAHFFITGGTGFFGHWLVESFLYANRQFNLKASASLLSRKPHSIQNTFSHLLSDPAITVIEGDVRNFIFPNGEFTHIIHAATDSTSNLDARDPLLMLDTIIDGTRHTLDFALQCKAERFLFTSSGAVYGRQPSEITHISEEYTGAPNSLEVNSAYGNGKRTAELLCSLYSKQFGLDTTIARCFAFVGPYLPLDAHFAIGNFMRDSMNGGPIVIKGDGTAQRSYLYMADLAIWLWTILFRGEGGRAYNVGSEKNLTIEETAHVVAGSVPGPIEVKVLGSRNPDQVIQRYVPSTQRAQTELKLHQSIALEDAIQRTFQFLTQEADR